MLFACQSESGNFSDALSCLKVKKKASHVEASLTSLWSPAHIVTEKPWHAVSEILVGPGQSCGPLCQALVAKAAVSTAPPCAGTLPPLPMPEEPQVTWRAVGRPLLAAGVWFSHIQSQNLFGGTSRLRNQNCFSHFFGSPHCCLHL